MRSKEESVTATPAGDIRHAGIAGALRPSQQCSLTVKLHTRCNSSGHRNPLLFDHANHWEIPASNLRPTVPLSPPQHNIDKALRSDPRPTMIRSKPLRNHDSALPRYHFFNRTTEPLRRSHSTPRLRNNSDGHRSLSMYEGRYRTSGKF
ncbi:unnamed protein product [Vicia faba]|uniref:Uncharacterized protein n=1 Tax=Vicia faba TaxID=3906 RepID=A0AAV1AM61_VICFA|nr:unnamed protein product [Vicia faba]